MEIFKLFGSIFVNNDQANAEVAKTAKEVRKAQKEFEELSAAAGEMALSVGAVAAAFATGIGVSAVMAADDLQKSLNKLQAQTGATDADMTKFKDSIMTLYRANVGESFDDIATGMSEIARTTGLTGKDLEATTKHAIALRDTFEFGVRESADTANSLMKMFGISAKEAYTLMAQGAQQGANKNGDLMEVMSEYSVHFKTLGFSAEQFSDVLIQGAQNGAFKIDVLADGLKEFNIVSKDGSKATTAAFEGLGMNAEQMTKAFATGGTTAQQAFTEVMKKLTAIEDPVKKNAIGVGLFRTKWEDLESKAIEALGNIESKTNKSADTLKKIDDVKYDSFGEALAGLGRNLKADLLIPLGDELKPVLEDLIKKFKEAAPEIKENLGGALKVVGALFTGLAAGVGLVIDNLDIVVPILWGVVAAMTAQFIIGTLIPMYKAWRVATQGQALAQAALNLVMKANPFGMVALVIGALVAAGILLYKNWDTVWKFAKQIWGYIASFFKTTVNGIKTGLLAAWEAIKAAAISVFNGLKTFFTGAFNFYKRIILGVWNGIKTALSAIWNGIKIAAGAVWLAIKTIITTYFNIYKTIIMGVWNGIKIAVIAVWNGIKASAKSVWGGITSIFKTSADKIKGFFSGLGSSIKSVFLSIVSAVKMPIKAVIGIMNTFIGGAESVLNSVINKINAIPSIDLPGKFDLGIPDIKNVKFGRIPGLAEGGSITKSGTVMVGEQGPEFLNLPRGASVVPLDKAGGVNITINNPTILNDRDAERLGDTLVRYLRMKGITPKGV